MNSSRRQFLKLSTGLTVGFAVGALPGCGNTGSDLPAAGKNSFSPNAWVNIGADGIITIFFPVDELGQGSSTALPVIFAEELDADWLSKQAGKPVKLTWSREDDFAAGWFKPASGHFLRAGVDGQGKINAWHHRVAVQEPLTTAEPGIYESIDRRPVISMPGTDHLEYSFPHQLVEHLPVEPGIRTFSVMAVGFTPNKFAVESFIDEVARQQNTDVLDFRMRHLSKSPRAQRVLDAVATMSAWPGPGDNDRQLGLAFAEYHHTLIAGVLDMFLEGDRIRVQDVWVAIDPGIAAQPDNIRSQVMGAVVYGLGNALTERITFRNGRVQEANFDDYPLPTMADTPQVHVEILPGGDEPSAVGQTGAVLVAPAIANAFEQLTGKRLRHMPFTRERVRNALNS